MSWARFAAFLVFLVSTLLFAEKKPECYHVTQDTLQQVYLHSPFAHGLRHGYETGYHDADLNYHLGYEERQIKLNKVPDTQGFRKSFGNKKSFRRGYEYGYLAGYRDSFAGRKFHYPPGGDGVPVDLLNARAFDSGVADGFRRSVDSPSAQNPCENTQPGYCEGFRLGVKFAAEERHAGGISVASGELTDRRR
jgi:hypothetical protein